MIDGSKKIPNWPVPTKRVTSYAQQFEDVMLWRALRSIPQGSYLDIGASDPRLDSVSRLFYEQGWRGVHVEPSKRQAASLRQDRPDELVIEAAVSDGRLGTLLLHETLDERGFGLGTLDEGNAKVANEAGWATRTYEVDIVTLDDIFAQCQAPEIHWLKIDVEGFEKNVLQGWTSPRRPWLVVIEAIAPLNNEPNHDEWEDLILALGYTFVWTDRVNRFYLHNSHSELKEFFTCGVNVLDGFFLAATAPYCGVLERLRRREAEKAQACQKELEALRALPTAPVAVPVAAPEKSLLGKLKQMLGR